MISDISNLDKRDEQSQTERKQLFANLKKLNLN